MRAAEVAGFGNHKPEKNQTLQTNNNEQATLRADAITAEQTLRTGADAALSARPDDAESLFALLSSFSPSD